MLVLTRRNGSSVRIGSNVIVTVLSSRRDQVRLGIEAPRNIRVLRDELDAKSEQHPSEDNDSPSAAGMKIVLVVEDDPLHAKMIRTALCRNQGTMVTVVDSARRGLDALGALTGGERLVEPDLILLDVHLRDGTGLEVLRAIRKDDQLRTTPVVMLTCCQDDSLVKECANSGANAYVVKSPRWNEFRNSINRIGQFWTNDCYLPNRYPLDDSLARRARASENSNAKQQPS